MTERELRQALRRAAPVEPARRERSWRVVRSAFAGPRPRRRRPSWASVVVATALLALTGVGAATAAAPDGGVSRWVRDVLGVAAPDAREALVRLPGGGKLLAAAGRSVWVVAADGGRRRIGTYSGASWSPRGRFLLAWRGRILTALDPRGVPRWSLARRSPIRSARWAPGDGFRVAYVAGDVLSIANGDGTGDRPQGRAAAGVAPAWRPDGDHVLAYVDARRRVNVVAVDERRRLWRGAPVDGVLGLGWSTGGRRLAVLTARGVLIFDRAGRRRPTRALPAGLKARAAAWAPGQPRLAVVGDDPSSGQSGVAIVDLSHRRTATVVFSATGRLGRPAWSPDGRRLLVAWPEADQWLFLDPARRGGIVATASMTAQFPAVGTGDAPPPEPLEWCCPVAGAGAGAP